MKVQGYLILGKISKPYGLEGELILALKPGIEEYIKEGNPLFVELDGQRVPFFLEDIAGLSEKQAIVKLEFVDSLEEAAKLTGCPVFAETHKTENDSKPGVDPGSLVDYSVVDKNLGELGVITGYISAEINPLWLIAYRGKEIMVPAILDFIVNTDYSSRTLTLDLPEGIMDL